MNTIYAFSIIAALTLWIPLFIYGIYRIIRKDNKNGVFLVATASLWCIIAFSTAVFAMFYFTYSTYQRFGGSHKTVDFKPEQYQGEMGEIVLAYGNNATINGYDLKKMTSIKSSGTDGRIRFPAGKYSLYYLSITEKDSSGKDWTLSVPLYRTFSNVTVSKDKPLEIKAAPPFAASVRSSIQSDKDVFDFEMKDGAGNSVSISDNTQSKPPKFQLIDSAGTVVFEKNFEYG